MTTYRPLFASEKLLAGPPYRGCRVSSIWHAMAIATHGETTLTERVRTKGQAARRADLRKGWEEFARTGDENGWPDQGDVVVIQDAMFGSAYPEPRLISGGTFESAWEAIGSSAVSIALDLTVVPASSPLRRYVGPVAHQVVLYDTRADAALVLDPMHPPSDWYIGHWCPKDDIRKAANAIEDGGVYAELYPAGAWTDRRLETADLKEDIADARRDLRSARSKIIDLEAEVARLENESDCTEAAEAAREQLLDSLEDWVAEQREADA